VDTGIWWENMREIVRLENPGVDRKIIQSWIFRKWDVGAWTGFDLVQGKDRQWVFVYVVKKFRVP
jgi:hypothetical protein